VGGVRLRVWGVGKCLWEVFVLGFWVLLSVNGRCSFGGLGCCEVFVGGVRLGVWGGARCLWEVFVWGFGVL